MSKSPKYRYDSKATRDHPAALKESQYLIDMDELFRTEERVGRKHSQQTRPVKPRKPVWNVDAFAKQHKKVGNITYSTVDFLAVACRSGAASRLTLLVELKLGVRTPGTIKPAELEKKCEGTRFLLRQIIKSQDLGHQKMLVIHRETEDEQYWRLMRRSGERGLSVDFMTEHDFRKIYSIPPRRAAIPVPASLSDNDSSVAV